MDKKSLELIYVDADCVVVNKPAGMASHPLNEERGDTALELVGLSYPELRQAFSDPREGALVHRLDTGTSGLLVFARNAESYRKLREAFSKGEIQKTYVAWVEGCLDRELVIEYPIAHHPKNKAKMIAVRSKNKYFRGKPQAAVTQVTPISYENGVSKIKVEIKGGRRHQIRVHLAAMGYPIMGDVLYGSKPITGMVGHALQADSVRLLNGVFLNLSDYSVIR